MFLYMSFPLLGYGLYVVVFHVFPLSYYFVGLIHLTVSSTFESPLHVSCMDLTNMLPCSLKFCLILSFSRSLTFSLVKTTGLSLSTILGNGK